MTRTRRSRPTTLLTALTLVASLIPAALVATQDAEAAGPDVVVSQVYGGGGNSGAFYTHDFIEIFNRGNAAADLTGWSVQYASATGSTWQVTSLSGTLQPGQYYLIQQAAGAGGTEPLPTPDATGSINMSATNGKVALVSTTTPLTGTCPSGPPVVDFVGFGSTANCFEGTGPTPTLSNPTAALRLEGGCRDTDDNAADFTTVNPPTPRNTASPFNLCDGDASPEPFVVALFDFEGTTVEPAVVAPGFDVSAMSVNRGAVTFPTGNPGMALSSNEWHENDNFFEFTVIPPTDGVTLSGFSFDDRASSTGPTSWELSIIDDLEADTPTETTVATGSTHGDFATNTVDLTGLDQRTEPFSVRIRGFGASSSAGTWRIDNVTLTAGDGSDLPAPSAGSVVVSQIYGGGGNSGAFYTHDFIEIFNRGNAAADLTGWSVQYASATGSTWQVTSLSGTLQPGQYYLIQQAQGAGGTEPLPTPDATGSINMSATNGKVALVSSTTALAGHCGDGGLVPDAEFRSDVVDFVGFGSTANCFEGTGPTPTLSNPTAALRLEGGCQDTDDNAADFITINPPTPRNTASPFNPCDGPPPDIPLSLSCVAPFTITEGFAAEDSDFVDGKFITATASGGSGDFVFEVTEVSPDPTPGGTTVEVEAATARVRFSDDVPGLDPTETTGLYTVTITVTDDESTADCVVDVRVVPILNIGHMRGVVPDDVNGRLHVSPYALGTPIFTPGAPIAVRGVVTQLTLEENPASAFDFRGFFIQSIDADPADIAGFEPGDPVFADGDPHTSDGLWVSTSTFPTVRQDFAVVPGQQYSPALGDIVTLRGSVIEDFQQTVMLSPFVVDVAQPGDSGVDLGAHIEVVEADPPDDIQQASVYWERLAGMQVQVPAGSLVVSGNDFFSPSTSEFWVIRGDHPVALRDDPSHRRVFRDYHPLAHEGPFDLTEGPGDMHGYRILLGSFGIKAAADDPTAVITPARSGDTLVDPVQGGLYFSFAKYQVMVDTQPELARGPDPSAASLSVVDGFDPMTEYSVMVYNVENLYDFRSDPFSGCDLDPDVVPPGQTPTSQCTPDEPGGSNVTRPFTYAPLSQEEYDAHRIAIAEQILFALQAPDIITIQEAEKQDVCVPVYDEANPAASFMECDLSAPAPGETMENTLRGSGAPDTVEELALEIFRMSNGQIRYEASGDAVNGRDVRGITQAFLHRVDRVELVPVDELLDDPVLGAGNAVSIPYPEEGETTNLAPWVFEAANPKAVNAVLAPGVAIQDGGRFPQTGFVFTRPVQVALFRIYPEGVGNGAFVERYVTSNHMSAGPDGRVEQRTEQARLNAAVADAVRNGGGQVIVTGDFNVFPRPDDPFPAFKTNPNRPPSDQLAAMYQRGYFNLHDVIIGEAPENLYSFIFRGVSQILDHIFVDALTQNELVTARFIHVNTDYPANTPGFEPGRGASDHDPLYARFLFDPCTTVITGIHLGPLAVTEGTTCLVDATVRGAVTVHPGASLRSEGSVIVGSLTAAGANLIRLCDTSVAGQTNLTGSSAVILGDPDAGCGPNRFAGLVAVNATSGWTVIAGNFVAGSLSCAANDPPPVNRGHPNEVAGPKRGQCSDL